MSGISLTGEQFVDEKGTALGRIVKNIAGFFRSKEITRIARIYHGDFTYALTPNTAIKNFYNMKKVTSIDAGDCYICIFEDPQYQGDYTIIGPGEKAQLNGCGSVVISLHRFSVDLVRSEARPPSGFWELDGPMYLWHFSSGYRYA